MPMLLALLAILVLLIIIVVALYNGLVRLRVQTDNAWSDIDVQLKRRYDLIPNVVETVKGYAAHESGTFEAVVKARNSAMAAQGPAAKAEAENVLTGALRQIFALSEAYPQLRAVESFTATAEHAFPDGRHDSECAALLQRGGARSEYENSVFPSNIIAGMFNFKPREFFEVSAPAERDTPKVSFGAPAAS